MSESPANQQATRLRVGLDLLERLLALGLYGMAVVSVIGAVSAGANSFNLLLLLSEGMVVVLILARRPARDLSASLLDWMLAVGATVAPILLRPGHVAPLAPPNIAASVMLVGMALEIVSKLALMRSFGLAPANRGVVTHGPYRYVRHPIYTSYLIFQIGFVMLNPTIINITIISSGLVAQILRLNAEERLLARDPQYVVFCNTVRYRIIPGIY